MGQSKIALPFGHYGSQMSSHLASLIDWPITKSSETLETPQYRKVFSPNIEPNVSLNIQQSTKRQDLGKAYGIK
jgi:hypothetical protein